MAVDIEQAGAIVGFVHQMVVPDLVVQCGGLGHELQLRTMCVSEMRGFARGNRLQRSL
jgi:hypothetical protein